MSPRAYNLGLREKTSEATRARIVAAALELLRNLDAVSDFSLDAVARQAGVVRATVYYQFRTRRGLLEALFDELAKRGLVAGLRSAFERADPLDRLDAILAAFGDFWASDRFAIRRLRSLAALDPELDEAIRARDELRRGHMRKILEQLIKTRSETALRSFDDLVNTFHTLSSFETFDTLAGKGRNPAEVTPLVQQLARAALDSFPDRRSYKRRETAGSRKSVRPSIAAKPRRKE
jgi:AcrR family transcriptional regulator